MASEIRDLAQSLAALDDDRLASLLQHRSVPPDTDWADFFDAAARLLSPGEIDRALRQCTADETAALHAASTAPLPPGERRRYEHLAMIGSDGRTYASVTAALPSLDGTAVQQPPALETDAHRERTGAEYAFTGVTAMAELLYAAQREPLSHIASGQPTASTRKRLTALVAETVDPEPILRIAVRTGLLLGRDRAWRPAPLAQRWLTASTSQRWFSTAETWLRSLPRGLRTMPDETGDSGWSAPDSWAATYPNDPDWPALVGDLVAEARAWGIVTDALTVPGWIHPGTRASLAERRRILEGYLPVEVDQLYLQHDLSAIAPGPLVPEIDARLRESAHREASSQAFMYRFSEASISNAIGSGESGQTLLRFLETISLTGVPQPLRYLIEHTAQRFGSVRVSSHDGHTTVTAVEAAMLAAISVDQRLRHLALRPLDGGAVLSTPIDAAVVRDALRDARYPVAPTGPQPRRMGAVSDPGTEMQTMTQLYRQLLERLRSADLADADGAWLRRELEIAVKLKQTVEVEIALPGDETGVFELEATGISADRFRGKDQITDVERTLPISRMRQVRVLSD